MRVSDAGGESFSRSSSDMRVAVLGASANPKRYSHQAVARLLAHGYTVFPINPGLESLLGVKVFAGLADLPAPPHTLTLYVGPKRSTAMADAILAARPRRVIFNPGAENPALAERLKRTGVNVLEACTLVLLSTNQFDDLQEPSPPTESEATEKPPPRPLPARH